MVSTFDWHEPKHQQNLEKHGVSFYDAQHAFLDPHRVIAADTAHSTTEEKRYYCFGRVADEVMTVRFTLRDQVIWLIGAGYWRKGRKIYETQNEN